MSDSTEALQIYIRAALALQGYTFSEERVTEITAQFARIAVIAATILPADSTLPGAQAPGTAPVFRP